MPSQAATRPVDDSVARINNEIAVGEDLDFQRSWWRFEKAVWIFFAVILALDLAGVFGRGPVANTRKTSADGAMDVKYERIERSETPSIVNIQFGQQAIRDNKIELFVSESIVDQLGAQRIIPSPALTTVGQGGLTYTFPANAPPASVQLALQPSTPGIYRFKLAVAGSPPVEGSIVVVP